MHEIVTQRYNEILDHHHVIWEWMVPVYLFLGGVAAGIMVLTAIASWNRKAEEGSRWLRLLPLAAPVIISIGMGCLFLDLSHKLYVWRFFLALQVTSPMSWGSWVLLGVYPATLALGLAGLTEREIAALGAWGPLKGRGLDKLLNWARGLTAPHVQLLRQLTAALGVILGVYTGVLLGTLGARALWNSALLGPLFLTSGLSAGAAFLLLFPLEHREHAVILRWDLGAIVTELVLIGLYLIGLSTGPDAARSAAGLLIQGAWAPAFWSLVVVGGLGVPLLMEAVELRRGLKPVAITSALVLMGSLSLRWILVMAGQG